MKPMKKVLTIAGSDCSGGAGVQADIKTITAHKMYAQSVITALTAQNTTGVYGIFNADASFVEKQLDCVFSDIFPDSVKIGMLSDTEIIISVSEKLKEYGAKNIVIDPVMISTSGHALISQNAMAALCGRLIPCAGIITPNIHEAEALCKIPILNIADMESAAKTLGEKYGTAVLVKGGHLTGDATDVAFIGGEIIHFSAKRIKNPNTHGTGCTLSSAIACNLAAGFNMKQSIKNAKTYVTDAVGAMLDLGKGSGPLNHMYNL